MANENVTLKININSNTGKVTGEINTLNSKLKETASTAKSIDLGDKFTKFQINTALLTQTIAGLQMAFSALSAPIMKFLSVADEMNGIRARISLVTDSVDEAAAAQERLLQIANRTGASLSAVSSTYTSLAKSTNDLGKSTAETLGVVETINKAIAVSGTPASSAAAALFQLSQAFGSGTLRGEELNSVLEQTPRLAQAIADGLGVSIAGMREMAAQGELTAEAVFNALDGQAQKIDEEFSQIPLSVSGAMTAAANNFDSLIDMFNQVGGATNSVTQIINYFSNSLSENQKEIVYYGENFIKTFQLMGTYAIDIVAKIGEALLRVPHGLILMVEEASNILSDFLGTEFTRIDGWSDGLTAMIKDLRAFQDDMVAPSATALINEIATPLEERNYGTANLEKGRAELEITKMQKISAPKLEQPKKQKSARSTIDREALAAQREAERKRQELLKANAEIEKAIYGDTLNYQLKILDEQIKKYDEMGVDKVNLAKHYEQERLKITEEYTKKEQDAHLESMEKLREQYETLGDEIAAAMMAKRISAQKMEYGGYSKDQIAGAVYGKDARDENYAKIEGQFGDMGGVSGYLENLTAIDEFHQMELERIEAHYALLEENATNHSLKMQEINKATYTTGLAQANTTFGAMGQMAQSFYTLSGNQNKAAFRAYQAFAVAQAIISTYQAASKALAEGGPYLGPVLMATAIATGMAQVAQIRAQKYHSGGYVSGNGEVPAVLLSGEGVLSRAGMKNLDALNSGNFGGQNSSQSEINIINSVDPSVVESWASSRSGRKVLKNIVKQ